MKRVALIVMGLVLVMGLQAQAKAPVPKPVAPFDASWEYLVVTGYPGKNADGKLMAYTGLGVDTFFGEHPSLEKSLDTLGALGWEVVSVMMVANNQQQILLKRALDPERSKKEKAIVERIKAQMVEEAKFKEAEAKKWLAAQEEAQKKQLTLVELDSYEAAQAEQAKREQFKKDLTTQLAEKFKVLGRSITVTMDTMARVTIEVDCSKLLTANTYRAKEVEALLDEATLEAKSIMFDNSYSVVVTLRGVIVFGKEVKDVGTRTFYGDRRGTSVYWY